MHTKIYVAFSPKSNSSIPTVIKVLNLLQFLEAYEFNHKQIKTHNYMRPAISTNMKFTSFTNDLWDSIHKNADYLT